tara:strand:- start:1642 stop:2037 length:396 start_codon:yes stop_codon:yes gene_type:complete
MQVKVERTGWRDQGLSNRHRAWGWDCPAVDIDFLMLEYDTGIPVALIEYKHARAKMQSQNHPSYRAISTLATRANIPFYAVRYTNDYSQYRIIPLNDLAKAITPHRIDLSEQDYVNFLYDLRNRPPHFLRT